jgi:parallel beta-helix repeat protein
VLCGLVLLFGMDAFAQGSLTPPGAPAATMKTLDQVEPRTPISSAPYTISQPGSYYLSTNLTSTGHGVAIAASGVTLDLMGFTLSGDRGSLDYGVFLDGAPDSAIRNVVVRNGIVRNFGHGVHAEYTQDSRFERLITATNLSSGIYLNGSSGRCDGNTIADCTISDNASYGVYLNGSSGQCDGNTIANCTISGNASYGVYLKGDSGQCDGNTIADCMIRKNAYCGIYIYFADGNRVEGNHISGQTGGTTFGVSCFSTARNLIVRNTCVGQTFNFDMSPNDTYGPIVTSSGALPTTGAGAHPWANFSR